MPQGLRFRDRTDAGRRLAIEVGCRFGIPSAVSAVSAGGGLVALAVARAFARPLVFTYCASLRLPWDDSPAGEFGAVDEDGRAVLDYASLAATRVGQAEIEGARAAGLRELRDFYDSRYFPRLDLIAPVPRLLLIDDGLDSGWRMEAAVALARRRRVSRVIVAAPCASVGAACWFSLDADGFVALSIGDETAAEHYDSFGAVTPEFLGPRVPRLRPRAPAAVV